MDNELTVTRVTYSIVLLHCIFVSFNNVPINALHCVVYVYHNAIKSIPLARQYYCNSVEFVEIIAVEYGWAILRCYREWMILSAMIIDIEGIFQYRNIIIVILSISWKFQGL